MKKIRNFTFRSAVPADAGALRDVTSDDRATSDYGSPVWVGSDWWEHRIKRTVNNGLFLVAECDSQIVGFLELFVDTSDWMRRHVGVLSLCVHENFRNFGIGRALMDVGIEQADSYLGLIRIELFVWVSNEPAIRLYESLDFFREGLHVAFGYRKGNHENALSMARINKKMIT